MLRSISYRETGRATNVASSRAESSQRKRSGYARGVEATFQRRQEPESELESGEVGEKDALYCAVFGSIRSGFDPKHSA